MNWLETFGFIHVVFYVLIGLYHIYGREFAKVKEKREQKMQIFQTEEKETEDGRRYIHTVRKEI